MKLKAEMLYFVTLLTMCDVPQLGTTTVGGKQTIVITKPGTGGPSGVRPQTSQIIVVTTASAVRGLQPAATTPITTPAGSQPAQVMTELPLWGVGFNLSTNLVASSY